MIPAEPLLHGDDRDEPHLQLLHLAIYTSGPISAKNTKCMSSRFMSNFLCTRILHIGCKRPGEKEIEKRWRLRLERALQKQGFAGGNLFNSSRQKMLKYVEARNS